MIGKSGTRDPFFRELRHDDLLRGIPDTRFVTEIDSPANSHINIRPDYSVFVYILCDQSFIKIAVSYRRSVLTEFENIESTADVFQGE